MGESAERLAAREYLAAVNGGRPIITNGSATFILQSVAEEAVEGKVEALDALNGLLSVIDRVLFNKPTLADHAKIEAAHKLARERRCDAGKFTRGGEPGC